MKLMLTTWAEKSLPGEYGRRANREVIEVHSLEEVKNLAGNSGFVGVAIEWRAAGLEDGVEGTIDLFNDICDDIC